MHGAHGATEPLPPMSKETAMHRAPPTGARTARATAARLRPCARRTPAATVAAPAHATAVAPTA